MVLVKEGGRWLVWDVRMGCGWSFRMGPTLRAMLGAASPDARRPPPKQSERYE